MCVVEICRLENCSTLVFNFNRKNTKDPFRELLILPRIREDNIIWEPEGEAIYLQSNDPLTFKTRGGSSAARLRIHEIYSNFHFFSLNSTDIRTYFPHQSRLEITVLSLQTLLNTNSDTPWSLLVIINLCHPISLFDHSIKAQT